MLKLTDIHCHILPKVDDGAKNLEMSYQMLKEEYEQGVRRIIVTPHYRKRLFEPSMNQVMDGYKQVSELAKKIGPDMEIQLGCEYHSHTSMVESMQAKERPTMADSNYVLVEFSSRHSFRVIWKQICDLQDAGFQPIIAHIERYPCLTDNIERISELSESGVLLQVNAGSIIGEEGFIMKRFCRKLMKQDLIDLVASDAHNLRERKPNLKKCFEYIKKKMGQEYAERIFVTNPAMIWTK